MLWHLLSYFHTIFKVTHVICSGVKALPKSSSTHSWNNTDNRFSEMLAVVINCLLFTQICHCKLFCFSVKCNVVLFWCFLRFWSVIQMSRFSYFKFKIKQSTRIVVWSGFVFVIKKKNAVLTFWGLTFSQLFQNKIF